MTVSRVVHAFAGALVLLSLLASLTVSPWFLMLAAFVGANLLQSTFTGFCPAAIVLRRCGLPDADASPGRTHAAP